MAKSDKKRDSDEEGGCDVDYIQLLEMDFQVVENVDD